MTIPNIANYLRVWRRYNRTLNELSRLSDRDLADIGVSRDEIYAKAWQHARDEA